MTAQLSTIPRERLSILGTEFVNTQVDYGHRHRIQRVEIVETVFKNFRVQRRFCEIYNAEILPKNVSMVYDPKIGSSFPPNIHEGTSVLHERLGLDEAVVIALSTENEWLQNKWRVLNRNPALKEGGLDRVAEKMGISRLLIGPTRPLHGHWRATPIKDPAWRTKATERGLTLVPT